MCLLYADDKKTGSSISRGASCDLSIRLAFHSDASKSNPGMNISRGASCDHSIRFLCRSVTSARYDVVCTCLSRVRILVRDSSSISLGVASDLGCWSHHRAQLFQEYCMFAHAA